MTAAQRMERVRARRIEAGQCPHCGTPVDGPCGKCSTERRLRGYGPKGRDVPTFDSFENVEQARGKW